MLKPLLARFARSPLAVIPDPLWQEALAALPCANRFGRDERERLRSLVSQLLHEKQMAGAGSLELNSAMQINIAIQACVPILNLGLDWYRGWTGIVVYPGEFLVPRSLTDDDGVVHEFVEPISGEAWDGGPVILSWDDAQQTRSGLGAPYAVVIHEFVHKLDQLNGAADGIPAFSPTLHPTLNPADWSRTLNDALDRFAAELDLIATELPPGLDPDDEAADPYYVHLPFDAYAAQDEAEFFAVSAEAFFVDPLRLQGSMPDWYAQLALFFRQDPALAGDSGT